MIDKKEPCLLIGDDTLLSKKYSSKIQMVKTQYSGKEHGVVPGIGLVNLLWYGINSELSLPVDFRVYDKSSDGKNKNTHFVNMLSLAKKRDMKPDAVVFDSWYSSLKNLKTIRDLGWDWVTGLAKNRKVNKNETLENLEIPEEGLSIYLRGYGWVTVFKFEADNGRIDFIATNIKDPSRDQIEKIMKARWSIEVYHRELKQTCGVERCQAQTGRAQRNHICLAILAWIEKEKRWINEALTHYEQDWKVIKLAIRQSIGQLIAFAKT